MEILERGMRRVRLSKGPKQGDKDHVGNVGVGRESSLAIFVKQVVFKAGIATVQSIGPPWWVLSSLFHLIQLCI